MGNPGWHRVHGPLWAVTIAAMKHCPPRLPCPSLLALLAEQPCHPAKINHPASHPPPINRSAKEQGSWPGEQLCVHSMLRACMGHRPQLPGSRVAGPCPCPCPPGTSRAQECLLLWNGSRSGGSRIITTGPFSLREDHTP